MKQCDVCGRQIEENDVIRAVVYKTSLMVAKPEEESYVKVRTLCPECDSRIEAFIEEVKHGEWINGFCSICGELNPTNRLNE